MSKLWGGRFNKESNELLEQFNSSIEFDKNLYKYDIEGSIAHTKMLSKQNLIPSEEAKMIIDKLKEIKNKIECNDIIFSSNDEDIHMAIEKILITELGEIGKKLHTARSRNDQVALDFRMYVRDQIKNIVSLLIELENTILEKAEKYKETMIPGFTHLQHAQPITIGFHMLAYFQQFKRDIERFEDCYKRTNISPLGSCALAGTTLPIDRETTSSLLDFSKASENAMDSVSDRDFAIEFLSATSICMMHLSRFCEEFIIWNSQEFSFIDIDEEYCTGSSIMPQKKNPDIPELIRGKTGRVYGSLFNLLTIMKGLPLAYNKDLQEDKEPVFDATQTIINCLTIFEKMLKHTSFKKENIYNHMKKGFLNATDIAENLVIIGVPFREAHETVGKLVKYCEDKKIELNEVPEAELKAIHNKLTKAAISTLSEGVLNRESYGGTSPKEIERQIKAGKEFIEKEMFTN